MAHHATTATTKLSLLEAGVGGRQPVQTFLNLEREAIVCLDCVHEGCVTSDLRNVEDDQKGRTGRLLFVADIGVPRHAAVAVGNIAFKLAGAAIAVNQVDFRVPLRSATCLSYVRSVGGC